LVVCFSWGIIVISYIHSEAGASERGNKNYEIYKVKIENERLDFRVFIDLLYGQNKNIDSDGDSNPVYSRNWTDLYVKKETISVHQLKLLLIVKSQSFLK